MASSAAAAALALVFGALLLDSASPASTDMAVVPQGVPSHSPFALVQEESLAVTDPDDTATVGVIEAPMDPVPMDPVSHEQPGHSSPPTALPEAAMDVAAEEREAAKRAAAEQREAAKRAAAEQREADKAAREAERAADKAERKHKHGD